MNTDPDEASDEILTAQEDVEPSEELPAEERVRKPKPLDPAILALFPAGAVVEHETISSAQRAWREATQREAPSIERLAERGTIERIDADLSSGYLAVVTADDTWRGFVPQAQLVLVVALMLRAPLHVVQETLAQGPGTLKPQ